MEKIAAPIDNKNLCVNPDLRVEFYELKNQLNVIFYFEVEE